MIVLDTDVLTLVQRANSEEYERLSQRLSAVSGEDICVTIVSFEEQMRGWLAWIAKAKTLERQQEAYTRLRELLDDFRTRPVLDFDDAAIEHFRGWGKLKTRLGAMDLRIAAIALANDALLLSRNLAHFRLVPGLKVEDWTNPIAGADLDE